MPEDMPEHMPDRMPEDVPEDMPEDMPDRMPEDMPDRMPDRMPEDMSEYLPEHMPDRMSDRMPEDMPDRMPEDLPDRMPEDMPEDMPDRMPDRMPEDTSDRMPEDLPVWKCINVMVGITRSKVILSCWSTFFTAPFPMRPIPGLLPPWGSTRRFHGGRGQWRSEESLRLYLSRFSQQCSLAWKAVLSVLDWQCLINTTRALYKNVDCRWPGSLNFLTERAHVFQYVCAINRPRVPQFLSNFLM